MLASGEASLALPQEADTGLHEVMTHTGMGLKAFLECLATANRQAEQSENDVLARRSYRNKDESAPFVTASNDVVLDREPGSKGVQTEQHERGQGQILPSTC